MTQELDFLYETGAADVSYTTRDFVRITELLRSFSGISMPETNEALVYSRLSKRVRELGLTGFQDYLKLVEGPHAEAEQTFMIEALTTNTTRFFREPYHFDIFSSEILPELIDKARQGARIRLWSAACSSGEEPYSLASVVLLHFPEALRFDFKILASDIDRRILAKAEEGMYHVERVEAIPSQCKKILFASGDGNSPYRRVREEVRALISFRYLNFVEPWPVKGPFDVIFCRNVMIYMDDTTQARIFASLVNVLRKGGLLFIGHSERLAPEHRNCLEVIGKTAFRRIG